ncbi:MAG: hypothetical protein ACRDOB_12335, partial [Streptosporangiaceae bacterium]
GLTMTGSCGSSSQTPDNTLQLNDSQDSTQTPSGVDPSGMSTLPGLDTVAGVIPGLDSATSQVPAISSLTSGVSDQSSPDLDPADLANSPSGDPSDGSDQSTSDGSLIPGSLSGVTGALPVGSLTGGLPNVGGVTGVLSGVTGPGQ